MPLRGSGGDENRRLTLDVFITSHLRLFSTYIAQARLVRFWIIGEHREIMRSCTAELVRGCWRILTLGTPIRLLTVSRGLCCRDELLLA
jgi:hypothetical protein